MPSDYTAAQLLTGGYTLNDVNRMYLSGRVDEATANAYFKEWCVGKCEHRWNAERGVPEECSHNSRTGEDTWHTMHWGWHVAHVA